MAKTKSRRSRSSPPSRARVAPVDAQVAARSRRAQVVREARRAASKPAASTPCAARSSARSRRPSARRARRATARRRWSTRSSTVRSKPPGAAGVSDRVREALHDLRQCRRRDEGPAQRDRAARKPGRQPRGSGCELGHRRSGEPAQRTATKRSAPRRRRPASGGAASVRAEVHRRKATARKKATATQERAKRRPKTTARSTREVDRRKSTARSDREVGRPSAGPRHQERTPAAR